MAKISIYSVMMEILSMLFGVILVIIGSVMYSPIDDGAFFYIIVIGGAILGLLGLALFINDMVKVRKQRIEEADEEEEELVDLEMAEEAE